MNLWVKASRLTVLVVLSTLFFTACDEELGNVGTDISGSQFDLLYKEFTLPSHVLIDSVNTAEQGLVTGSYIDPEFGRVTAEAYSAFGGFIGIDLSDSKYVFDKLQLVLILNSYYYGTKSETSIPFKIHKLTKELIDVSEKTNYAEIPYDINPIGEFDYVLDPDDAGLLEIDTIYIDLDDLYFQRVVDILTEKDAEGNGVNTALDIAPAKGFNGFAILAGESEAMAGISTASNLLLTYHTFENGVHNDDQTTYQYSFNLDRYNKITSDRSGTSLEGLTDNKPNSPFIPANNKRYVQNGTGITTEIDFQEVLDFFNDDEGHPELNNMVINSVTLDFGEIEDTDIYDAPLGLVLNQTNEENVQSSIIIGDSELLAVANDLGEQLFMGIVNDDSDETYIGLPTAYFQLLNDQKVGRSTAVLRTAESVSGGIGSTVGYTVDRFVIHKDSIKLKMYYTIPKQ